MFLVGREQPVFDEERNIAESIADFGIVVDEIRRDIENDFHLLERNQFQPFAAVVVVRGLPRPRVAPSAPMSHSYEVPVRLSTFRPD